MALCSIYPWGSLVGISPLSSFFLYPSSHKLLLGQKCNFLMVPDTQMMLERRKKKQKQISKFSTRLVYKNKQPPPSNKLTAQLSLVMKPLWLEHRVTQPSECSTPKLLPCVVLI